MKYTVIVNGKEHSVEMDAHHQHVNHQLFEADILEYKKGRFHILHQHKSFPAELVSHNSEEKAFIIKVNNNLYNISVKDKYDELLHSMGMDIIGSKKVNDVKAPMPGMVLKVMVENGQPIKKGDSLLVLEAMKMENILKAPTDGVIKKIHVKKGDKVEKNQVMLNLN